ncbi:hypothetical protein J2847_001210 [Azospirillum agricola]|uniref:SphA family protein n=1 Tax=Azospirillum agricola TaxID=1720247 RepID=UPI001AE88DC0|nr:transporter [Azospirillum agricola]MBP2227928.1 hypothetical protein [Azospirillum agricola]
MKIWTSLVATAALALSLASAAPAGATEAETQYPNGAEGFMAGAVPPPGVYFLNYLTHYTTNRLNDGSGDRVPVHFRLNATAEVARFVWTSDVQVLGANWGMHILTPLVNLEYELGPNSVHQFGLGDITIDPVILSWHWKNFHLATGLDVILPTGRYDKAKPLNIGANYWGFEPLVAGTYLSDDGFEVSAKLMYTVNTKNTATDYRSGQAFHMDYMVGQHIGDWTAGVGGYWFRQTSDDRRAGVGIGNRGRAFAAGPAVKYDVGGVSLIGRWQHEFASENRPQGDKFWFKFVTAL